MTPSDIAAAPRKRRRDAPATTTRFVDGTAKATALATDPRRVDAVRAIRAEMRQLDQAHAMSLAMLRRAADLTQAELAERLGSAQGNVARTEHQPDMLLSTLRSYLAAAGADMRVLVTLPDGRTYELDVPGTNPSPSDP